MAIDDQKPMTSLPFEVRLERAEFDTASIAILSVITAKNRMQILLSVIYDRRVPGQNLDPTDTELSVLFNDAWIALSISGCIQASSLPQRAGPRRQPWVH